MASIKNVAPLVIEDFLRCFTEGGKLIISRSVDAMIVYKHPKKKFTHSYYRNSSATLF